MNFSPLLDSNPTIMIHAGSACAAILLGPVIFYNRKGTGLHRWLGKLWAALMAVAIVSSAFLSGIKIWGPFSPIHFFTVLGDVSLINGMRYVWQGRIDAHKAAMKGLYFWSLGVAGVLSFLPGRIMSQVLFPSNETGGFVIVILVFASALVLNSALRRKRTLW